MSPDEQPMGLRTAVDAEELRFIASYLDGASRHGAEDSRVIILSDTTAREIANILRQIAGQGDIAWQ